ncbi:SRPBCC family protein [Sphaerotilaceae bacterium SBD11-9]
MASDDSARASTHSRLIDAPREKLLQAVVQAEHLARWWGPDGFSSSFELFEPRPGGHWRFVMHGPDGSRYPNENVFLELGPERVVIDHLSKDHHFVLTIGFEAVGAQTRVHWHQLFDSAEHLREVAAFVGPANEQNLARLADEVTRVR